MISVLSKIFIKSDMTDESVRSAYGKMCGSLGIFLNLLLFTIKLIAGLLSGAIAIVADAFNNLSDAGGSVVALIGFKCAEAGADEKHPYGHGRVEYLAGLIVSCLIFLMGFELLKESIKKIINPVAVNSSPVIIGILIFSILVKAYMAFYNHVTGKRINSATLGAVAIDSISDCGATSIVLLTTVIAHYSTHNYDGIAGIIVSLFVFYAGISSARESVDHLLGSHASTEVVEDITEFASGFNEKILAIHDLIVHDYGPGRMIISLHAEVPSDGNIVELHDVIDDLEKALGEKFKCLATIHMDPVEVGNPFVDDLKTQVKAMAHIIDERITIHDFRVLNSDVMKKLIFDMCVPYSIKMTSKEIIEKMDELIKLKYGEGYMAMIEIDRV